METFLAAVGALVVAGGGGAVIAIAIVRLFATSWLEQQFAKQLETFKHEQQKEMEHVRYRINAYFDRAVRLHAMEFEVLPEIWKKLFDVYHQVERFANYGRMIHDLNKFRPQELETLLSDSPLYEYQKGDVRAASDKTKTYYAAEHYHERQRVRDSYYAFTEYFMKNAVFLSPAIEAQLEDMRGILSDAIFEKEFRHDHGEKIGELKFEKLEHLKSRGKELLDDLRKVVREHLQDSKRQMDFNS